MEQFVLENPSLRQAIEFMVRAHGTQQRKTGGPYYEHPVAVCRIVMERFGVKEEKILRAALFHDVLEDTPVTRAELAAAWGDEVAGIVAEVTKSGRPAGMEKEAYARRVYGKLRGASAEAKVVKTADRIHNLQGLEQMGRGFLKAYVVDTELLLPTLEDCPYVKFLKADFARVKEL
jgi:(p)ppGpp synthase/HD superfamily hydrolase